MVDRILVVEDEVSLQETLAYNLKHQGYEVETVGDGVSALDAARRIHPDLILLDVMLPEMDGFEVCRIIRQEMNTPVLILTARDDEIDRVVGLELGADDYMTKPFSMRELVARVRAVLRRVDKQDSGKKNILRADDITLDPTTRMVTVDGRSVDLTPSEFDLLAALIASPGRVFSRSELLDRLQGTTYEGYERSIDVHVRNLRTKIEPDPSNPRYVETIYGTGYRFHPQS